MDAPETVLCIKFRKYLGSTHLIGDFIQGWNLVMILDDGFVEVSGVKAHVEGTIWLWGLCQGGYQFHLLSDWGYYALAYYIL